MADRAARDFDLIDLDGDGRITPAEWLRRGNFQILDKDASGALDLEEVRTLYSDDGIRGRLAAPILPQDAPEFDPSLATDMVLADELDRQTLCGIGRGGRCGIEDSQELGLIETGLGPEFPVQAACFGIDDYYALNYAYKRPREALHGGIDLPAPTGTPILAVAAGTVAGVFEGASSARGIEIVLRHAPRDTGLPFWTYTQYAHLSALPRQRPGQRVRMGEVLGPTGNTGINPMSSSRNSMRRPAVHFAVWFSDKPNFVVHRETVIPVKGRWMDPNALYRQKPPYDSPSLKALSDNEKFVPVPVMLEDGSTLPAATRLIWPYACFSSRHGIRKPEN